jgi:GTP cyclohydrolase I
MVKHWVEHNSPHETVDVALARTLLQRQMPTGAVEQPLPEHMKDTPARFVNMLSEMTAREEFNFTTFKSDSDDMVVLDRIPFYTLCAHHVVPFYGFAYIGYVPSGRIAGLSKFARAVRYCARGFHVQEELTRELADFLEDKLYPEGSLRIDLEGQPTGGLAVVLRAEHMCMAMRGVATPGVMTTTSRMTGVFADHKRTAKAEFMSIIKESW